MQPSRPADPDADYFGFGYGQMVLLHEKRLRFAKAIREPANLFAELMTVAT